MLRNSKRDTKKGDKMQDKWTGTYQVVSINEKGVCYLQSLQSQLLLKNGVNVARLKLYYSNHCQEDEKELKVAENGQDSSNRCQEDEKELNVALNDQDSSNHCQEDEKELKVAENDQDSSNRCQEDEKELNVAENDQDSSNRCQEDEKELNVTVNDQDSSNCAWPRG